jgi:hypothetical protein
MIDALRLTAAWALAWLFGAALVTSLTREWRAGGVARSHVAWTLGCGFFAGAFGVTVWMRALSFVGVRFSVPSIALPLATATIAMTAWLWRPLRITILSRSRRSRSDPLSRGWRLLWVILLAWLALRFAMLLLEVIWTPLYPWDAWIQWATKARVWYALGHIVPFARSDAWFAANGAAWFDASPNYPATVPLWQVWSSVALGRWDDALMNLPWWLTAVAFALAIYGALRSAGFGASRALIGTWLVSSLPLANVHVALAGYADFPMAVYYALAAISVWRWTQSRTLGDAALALLFAIACLTIKTPGIVWALTLLPAVVLALWPNRGPRILAIGIAVAVFALLVLAQTHPVVLGYRLHLDFEPAWSALVDSFFLLGNWNLLWYAVIASAVIGWRVLRRPPIVALSAIMGAGLLFLAIVFAFTNARNWVTDQTTINRATLHIAPLAAFWMMVIVDAWLRRARTSLGAAPAPMPSA